MNRASGQAEQERLRLKTPEMAFLRVMTEEFGYAPRVSREILSVAQELLVGERSTTEEGVRIGQIRTIVAKKSAPFGPPLAETEKITVTLTVDGGQDDIEVEKTSGKQGVRHGRILRLLEEALEQGGVLTQEDLARVLNTSSRTIRRDVQALKAAGHTIHTRGQVKGVGRGQTHKVQIIRLWLQEVGYSQIVRQMHHSTAAIKRYIQTFLRIVRLHREKYDAETIQFLCKTTARVVKEYLALYEEVQKNKVWLKRLENELERVTNWSRPVKKTVTTAEVGK